MKSLFTSLVLIQINLIFVINSSKNQVVEIEYEKLKENYPEFTSFLIEQSSTTPSLRQPSVKPTTTVPIQKTLDYSNQDGNELSFTLPKQEQLSSTLFITSENKPIYSMTTSPISTKPDYQPSRNSNFLYFNNKTNKFEGVSLQSTYSLIRLMSTKNLTLITSTTPVLPIYSPLPIYHQFIYTIKISDQIKFKNNKDLVDYLNDQSQESSQLRVNLLKLIGKQLDLNYTSLKLNWIEKLNKNISKSMSANSLNSNEIQANSEEQLKNLVYSSELLNEYNYDLDNIEPIFLPNDPKTTSSMSSSQISLSSSAEKIKPSFYYILISVSSVNLLDLQKSLLNVNQANMNQKFKHECEKFFKQIKQKHEQNNFRLNLLNQTTNRFIKGNNKIEYLKKVQFIKLCNLKEIINILKISDQQKQLEQAQYYIKGSTEELLFNTFKLNDYDNLNIRPFTSEENYDNDEDNGEQNEYSLLPEEDARLINFKSPQYLTLNQSNITLIVASDANEPTQVELDTKATFAKILATVKEWFWKVIPEEDFLLAVIVPCTIVVSLFVLTVVVACLLHMCNKTYNESKRLISISNTTDSTSSHATTSIEKSVFNNSSSSTKSNPIYKQRAYLSKGVPVILYEEMSDKPIEDYDENDIENGGMRSGTSSSYYRSPLIMRNEKPPMPAPPEYTRQTYFTTPKSNENILNELQSMLQQSANIISLADSPDDFSGALTNKSSPSNTSPQIIDVDDSTQLLYQPPQPLNLDTSSKDISKRTSDRMKNQSLNDNKSSNFTNPNFTPNTINNNTTNKSSAASINLNKQLHLQKLLP